MSIEPTTIDLDLTRHAEIRAPGATVTRDRNDLGTMIRVELADGRALKRFLADAYYDYGDELGRATVDFLLVRFGDVA